VPSSPEHDKARGGATTTTTNLPGFCPAVWRPDVCRPLAALGPDPLCLSGGTLATKKYYLALLRKANEGEPRSVIWFTKSLALLPPGLYFQLLHTGDAELSTEGQRFRCRKLREPRAARSPQRPVLAPPVRSRNCGS
jgi:hypothetical protein